MFRRLFCCILAAASLFLLCPKLQAGAEDARITGSFHTLGVSVTWEYPYSDAFFSLPPDRYDHRLARLSLGMALSAFRDGTHPETQDDEERERICHALMEAISDLASALPQHTVVPYPNIPKGQYPLNTDRTDCG